MKRVCTPRARSRRFSCVACAGWCRPRGVCCVCARGARVRGAAAKKSARHRHRKFPGGVVIAHRRGAGLCARGRTRPGRVRGACRNRCGPAEAATARPLPRTPVRRGAALQKRTAMTTTHHAEPATLRDARAMIHQHERSAMPRLRRLWSYFRNELRPALGQRSAEDGRWYRLGQEEGLPARILGHAGRAGAPRTTGWAGGARW